MRIEEFFRFIRERHSIYDRRMRGKAKPWTKDVILQNYRFCNVNRELDTVTKWLRNNWYNPNAGDSDLWFAAVVARLINWPDTLKEIGFPKPFNPGHIVKVLQTRTNSGEKTYTSAYMITTHNKKIDKAEYVVNSILVPMFLRKEELGFQAEKDKTLEEFCKRLCLIKGIGPFFAGQVIADVKYDIRYNNVEDWWSFAVSGTGSRRGLNRVMNLPTSKKLTEEQWKIYLDNIRSSLLPLLKKAGIEPLHAQDVQNCLCEFDKYERVRLGEGSPRSRYNGGAT